MTLVLHTPINEPRCDDDLRDARLTPVGQPLDHRVKCPPEMTFLR